MCPCVLVTICHPQCDIVTLESTKVLRYFPPGNGNLSDLEHNPLKSENTMDMDRRVEIKKNPTKSKTARVKDNERGEMDVEAAKQQAVERKGDKGGKSEIPIEELSREKGKKKQGRTESDKKERKRLMPVLILNYRCSSNRWEAAPEYFQFLALHWHVVSAAQPALDGSQVAHESNLLLRRCKSRRMVTHIYYVYYMHHRFRRKYGRSG